MKQQKICDVCNNEFNTSMSYQKRCNKICMKIASNKHKEKNYRKEKENISKKNKIIYSINKEEILHKNKINRLKNIEKNKDKIEEIKNVKSKGKLLIILEKDWLMIIPNKKEYNKNYSKKWYMDNKEYINEYNINRYHTDNNYKFVVNFSNSVRGRFKQFNVKKQYKTEKLLGCSMFEFRKYIEKKFLPGMIWDNHGYYGWHLDHIIPISSFNLNNKEEQLMACNFTNFQPLWRKDNLEKSNKILEVYNNVI